MHKTLEEYDDKVYLKNGDRITGNIKELDRGKLRVKTITMDTDLPQLGRCRVYREQYLPAHRQNGWHVHLRSGAEVRHDGESADTMTVGKPPRFPLWMLHL